MKHLTLVILLALAPLSWGEDVYYCSEELRYEIGKDDLSGLFKLKQYREEKFTLKYEADSNRLAFKGRMYGEELFFMDCRLCLPSAPYFDAISSAFMFTMDGDRFFVSGSTSFSADMRTGTCAKF